MQLRNVTRPNRLFPVIHGRLASEILKSDRDPHRVGCPARPFSRPGRKGVDTLNTPAIVIRNSACLRSTPSTRPDSSSSPTRFAGRIRVPVRPAQERRVNRSQVFLQASTRDRGPAGRQVASTDLNTGLPRGDRPFSSMPNLTMYLAVPIAPLYFVPVASNLQRCAKPIVK